MEEVITSFREILANPNVPEATKINRDQVREIIGGLSAERGDRNLGRGVSRYQDFSNMLEPVIFTSTRQEIIDNILTDTAGTLDITGQERLTLRRIGGGTYGIIYLSNLNTVYKRVRLQAFDATYGEDEKALDTESFYRELFVEPFIQTVLQLDPTYGQNIAKLERVYRENRARTRIGTGSSSAAPNYSERAMAAQAPMVAARAPRPPAEPLPESNHTFFYKMEHIPYNLYRVIENPRTDKEGVFTELATILNHFNTNYGFFHRDLHGGNIMFDAVGNIKIIDFGKSCIIYSGINYSISNNEECKSYDLFILITFLLQHHDIPELTNKFRNLLRTRNHDFYELMTTYNKLDHTFHKAYYNVIDPPTYYPWTDPALKAEFIREIGEARFIPGIFIREFAAASNAPPDAAALAAYATSTAAAAPAAAARRAAAVAAARRVARPRGNCQGSCTIAGGKSRRRKSKKNKTVKKRKV